MRSTRRRLLLASFAAVLALGSCSDSTESYATGSIPAIENDLVATDPAVRARAAAELADRFPEGAVAVPMLVDLLDDESPEVVAAAARSLDALAIQAVPVVAQYCTRTNDELRRVVSVLPAAAAPSPATLFAAGWMDDLTQQGAACAAVAATSRTCRSSEFSSLAVAHIRRSEGDTLRMASAALALFGAEALADRGIAPMPNARRRAAGSSLVSLLRSNDAALVICGARLAERLRDDSPELVGALADALIAEPQYPKVSDSYLYAQPRIDRVAAADAIAAIGPAAASSAPNLIARVRSRDPFSSSLGDRRDPEFAAVRALVRIGRVEELRSLVEEPTASSSLVAAAAAQSGCPPTLVLGPLLKALRTAGPRADIVAALEAMGTDAQDALPAMRAFLAVTESVDERVEFARTILALAPGDTAATQVLLTTLDGEDLRRDVTVTRHAREAWIALCRRGAPTGAVLARLVGTAINNAVPYVGIEALGRVGPLASPAVPALLELAAEKDPNSRSQHPPLAVALGRIGPAAAAAVPILQAWKTSGDETIRVPAAQALRRIQAKK